MSEENKVKVTLDYIIDEFAKVYVLTDSAKKALRLIIANYFEQKINGLPIWSYIVESIGGMKTTLISVFETVPKSYECNSLTPKTLKSSKKEKRNSKTIGEQTLERIDNKVWLFKDFTYILSQNENDRKAVYADLRDLYDCKMSWSSGSTIGNSVISCRTTILACVTETIYRQGYNMQIMGERFNKIKLDLKEKRTEIIHKALVNEGVELEQTKNFQFLFETFFKRLDESDIWFREIEVKEQILNSKYAKQIEALADYITRVRVYCYKDPKSTSGYIEEPLEEHGSRFVKILLKMAILLVLVGEKEKFGEEEMQCLIKFAEDSAIPIKIKILELFRNHEFKAYSTSELHDLTKLNFQNLKAKLDELEASHILISKVRDSVNGQFTEWYVEPEIQELIEKIYFPDKPKPEKVTLGEEQNKKLFGVD